MFRTLFLKELREAWWLGLLPLAMMLYYSASEAEFGLTPGFRFGFRQVMHPDDHHSTPLGSPNLALSTLLWGSLLGAALGLWQTFRESQARTWHFLFHRPVGRLVVLLAKILTALVVFVVAIAVPAVAVCAWAATPGTHASPFHWSLTGPVWFAVAAGSTFYLAALFAGLRRGHLLGTRWWPLIGVAAWFGTGGMSIISMWRIELQWLLWGTLLVVNLLLVATVRDELRAADFN